MHRKTRYRATATAVLLGVISQWGCSTTKLPEYSSASSVPSAASPQSKHVEKDGVKVTLDVFADKARSETYFGINAPAAGVAIFHLRIENQSADTTWLLRKADCKLRLQGEDSTLAGANTKQSTAAGEALILATGGGLLFVAIGGNQIQHASAVQRNFTEKELRDRTISPGKSVEGFMYYKMPKKKSSFSGTLEISLSSTRDQQTNTLQVPISYETK